MREQLTELVLKFSINNQISLGLQNVFRKPKDVFANEQEIFAKHRIKAWQYKNRDHDKRDLKEESFDEKLERLYPTLDITKKSQRSKKANILRAGFPKNSQKKIPPFGAKQGQKLRESGAAIDWLAREKGGAARIVTLTLVGDTHEAFECLAANSGYAVNRLFQVVRRHGLGCQNWFFVWEYQKRGALHLHICLWHEVPNMAAKLGAKLVQTWYKVLKDIQSQTGIDMFVRRDRKTYTQKQKWQSRNEPMRKSAGGYFSKYASKASKKEERKHIRKLAERYPPSRFWGSSKSVKDIIKAHSFEYRFESWKSDEPSKIYQQILEKLLSENVAVYNEQQWLVQIDLYSNSGSVCSKRTVSEGFRGNFYYSLENFCKLKVEVEKMLRDEYITIE